MKIRYVTKLQEYGCVPACIAMVLGWNYEDVADRFINDFTKKGIRVDLAKSFICEHGFSVIEKRPEGFMDIELSNKRMLVPFAEVHIVSFTQCIDLKHGHSVVMDSKGKILDPDTSERYDPLTKHYSVDRVLGFWRELKT